MAIDQDGGPEIAVDAGHQTPQRAMIGLIEDLDPAQRLADRQPVAVDLLGVADDARHRAEPPGHPH